jgi:hypothetical protein
MKTIILALLLTFTFAQAKMITICDEDGCKTIYVYGDD